MKGDMAKAEGNIADEYDLTKGGTLPRYLSEEEMQKRIDAYFDEGCLFTWTVSTKDDVGNPVSQEVSEPRPTIAGLASYLGFADRQSIYDYKKRNTSSRLACLIKKALLRIDARHEGNLYNDKCTGSIFYLKHRGMVESKPQEPPKKKFGLPFGKAEVKE